MRSPCKNVCVLDPVTGLCVGCWRTIGEIAGWAGFTDGERQRIMGELGARANGRDAARLPGDTDSAISTTGEAPAIIPRLRPKR